MPVPPVGGNCGREGFAIQAQRRRTPLALIVDDAPDTRTILKALASRRGFDVIEAADGKEGLDLALSRKPDLILLDIRMPNMDGLTALSEIREEDPNVSVVIISAESDEDTLEEALSLGAANFVHKPFDAEEVQFVLDRIYRAIEEEASIQDVLQLVGRRATEISFPSDASLLSKIVAYLGRELTNNYPGYDIPLTDVKLALYEALANALEHGNLEITFDQKTQAMEKPAGILDLINERLADERLSSRKIHVGVDYTEEAVAYAVRDEGPGFDPQAQLNKPVADTSALHGRGITLIRHYMDDVSWNDSGNEIRLTMRLAKRGAEA
ncbi:MAG: response regulator [Planctomycetota bacterium]|nr:response regulator [Planctomycetota bacterium]